MDLGEVLRCPQYSLSQQRKEAVLLPLLNDLSRRHRSNSPAYAKLSALLRPDSRDCRDIADIPYLPVALFKKHALVSVPPEEVSLILTSSGTSGAVSRIHLDRETSSRQSVALASIMTHFLGPQRLPMIILDSRETIDNRKNFSARTVGILGMMRHGRDHFFALDTHMNLDEAGLRAWLTKHTGTPLLLFGFTFMAWQYFYSQARRWRLDLSSGTLIHSGGWKKLQDLAVGNQQFKDSMRDSFGLEKVHNFYGMVEQVGGVFMECARGFFHTPTFADIIVRDPADWQPAVVGQTGVLQLLSVLPTSYPGHSILSEDLGTLSGIDDCRCGRLGKYFLVEGRVPRAELRGCSDTHAYSTFSAR